MAHLAATSRRSASLWLRLREVIADALRVRAEVNQIIAEARFRNLTSVSQLSAYPHGWAFSIVDRRCR
jgi:hypothetical protein